MHLPSLKAMKLFAKMHSNKILTGFMIGGIVAGDILIAKAARKEAIDGDKKHYILPVFLSAGTIGICIVNGFLNKKQIESLSLLAASSIGSLANYQKNVQKVITPEQQESLDELMIEADAANKLEDCETNGDKQLYYLPQYGIIFWSDETAVRTAELNLNQLFTRDMFATLGDFLTFLGINSNEWDVLGDKYVWRFNYHDIDDGIQYITFNQYQLPLSSGINCNYIYFITEAMTLDEWQAEYQD